jgi:hypothetical protein
MRFPAIDLRIRLQIGQYPKPAKNTANKLKVMRLLRRVDQICNAPAHKLLTSTANLEENEPAEAGRSCQTLDGKLP